MKKLTLSSPGREMVSQITRAASSPNRKASFSNSGKFSPNGPVKESNSSRTFTGACLPSRQKLPH